MAVKPEIEHTASLLLKAIEDSTMPVEEKQRRAKMILSCKEATNGYSEAEKIQIISENDFNMAETSCFDKIDSLKFRADITQKLDTMKNEMEGNQKTIIQEVKKVSEKIDQRLDKLTADLDENNKTTAKLDGKMSEMENTGKKSITSKFWVRFFDTVDRTKWQITIIVGIIAVCASVAPSFAKLMNALIEKI